MKKFLLGLSLVALCVQTINAQLYEYKNHTEGDYYYIDPNITGHRVGRGGGSNGAGDGCPIGFNTKDFSVEAIFDTSMPCIVVELAPDPFAAMNITSISADLRITDLGPIYVRYSYSIDSCLTWIDAGFDFTPVIADCGVETITGTWDIPDFSTDHQTYFKISGFGALDSTGRLNVTNINIYGTMDIIDEDGDGYAAYIDCDDTNPDIHPGALELCNDIDENCDGITSEVTATIVPTGDIYICKHEFVTLYGPECYASYQWLKNGYIMPGMTESSVTTEKPGYYQVIVVDGECTDTSEVQAVAVLENPFANIYSPEGLDLCFDDSLKIKASYAPDYTFQWYKDGEAMLYENYYKILATEVGEYYCVITTFFGCTRTTEPVTVIASCKIGAGINSSKGMMVYPNPAKENITLTITTGDDISTTGLLEISNMNGQIIKTESISIADGTMNQEINVSDLTSGIYIIKFTTDNKQFTEQFSISN